MEEGCGETIYVVGMGSGERYIKALVQIPRIL